MKKIITVALLINGLSVYAGNCKQWKKLALKNAKSTSSYLYKNLKKCDFKSVFETYLSHKANQRYPNECYETFYRAQMIKEITDYSKECKK